MAEPNARSHAGGSGATIGLALTGRSAAEAPVVRAKAAKAAIVSFFIIQPLPVVLMWNDLMFREFRQPRTRLEHPTSFPTACLLWPKFSTHDANPTRRKGNQLLPF